MDAKTEELMLKIADYNNVERNFLSKRMCAMFLIALVGMVVYAGIDLLGLSGAEPYETIISIALGFVVGTLITGLLYCKTQRSKSASDAWTAWIKARNGAIKTNKCIPANIHSREVFLTENPSAYFIFKEVCDWIIKNTNNPLTRNFTTRYSRSFPLFGKKCRANRRRKSTMSHIKSL